MATAPTGIEIDKELEERAAFTVLHQRLLEGAAERIHADVAEAERRGLIDSKGNLLFDRLPADMQPGAKRDFGG